jgi:hypothetical protein
MYVCFNCISYFFNCVLCVKVINDLKVRIDAYAQGIPDFAELVRRGLKHQAMRNAELDSDRRTSARSARFAPKHYRLAFDQAEDRELSTSKNFAYAAIVLAQLCQLLSAYALQHCAGIEYPRGSRSSHSSRQ